MPKRSLWPQSDIDPLTVVDRGLTGDEQVALRFSLLRLAGPDQTLKLIAARSTGQPQSAQAPV